MREADIAWFAGIFEGEGNFETSKRSTARMTIAMTDKDVIDRVNAIFPGFLSVRRNMRPVKDNYNPPRHIYCWRQSSGAEVTRIITLILPWLGERRRAKAVATLAHIANRKAPGAPRSTHCKHGHPLSGDNLMPRSGSVNYVRCRTCYKGYQTAAALRRKKATSLPGQVISA